jgi:hypothetical protein
MTKAAKDKIAENPFSDNYLTRKLSLQESIRIAADFMLTKYEDSSSETDPDDVARMRDFTLGCLLFLDDRAPDTARALLEEFNSKQQRPRMSAKPLKQTLALMFAEAEAGKISVYFFPNNNHCLLLSKDGVRLLTRSDSDLNTFEFVPEDYKPPTKGDIRRLEKSVS